jgi:hypothetical protein
MAFLVDLDFKSIVFGASNVAENVRQVWNNGTMVVCLKWDNKRKNTLLCRYDFDGQLIWTTSSPKKDNLRNDIDLFVNIQGTDDLRVVTYCGFVFAVDLESGSLKETGEWIK